MLFLKKNNISLKHNIKIHHKMRTKLLTLVTLTIASFTLAQDPIVDFPDPNFKNALLQYYPDIDANNDGEIQVSEAEAYTGALVLFAVFPMISDLTGIEHFINITELDVGASAITTLDLSSNTLLEVVYSDACQLTSINVNNCPGLELLWCGNNYLTTLDVSNNSNLISLGINSNQLENIDLSNNTLLEELYCFNNQLTSLNLFSNTALKELLCDDNQLTKLNLNNNPNLEYLFCTGNQITSLNLSNNPELKEVFCTDNQLTILNIKNGHNTDITNFEAKQNPNLTCIQVDDPDYSTTNWTNIDTGTTFSENCNYNECIVNIPDQNFKNALLTHTPTIDTNGDGEIQCDEAEAFTGSMFMIFKSISDMTGIDAFVNMTNLYCGFNSIANLDVSNNTQLEMLYCQNNQITNLNINGLANLNFLFCSDNQLTTLDISTNVGLTSLYCYSNQIETLNINNNVNLTDLMCFYNELNALDLSNNTNLEYLACENNELTTLDLSNNTEIKYLRCHNNQIAALDLSNHPDLTDLQCQFNQLSYLNVKNGNNTSISTFNSISNLDLTCIEVDDPVYSTTNWTAKDAWSTFAEDCTVSIKDVFATENISVYPNPVNDVLHFSSNAPIEKVIVSNMLGQQIKVNLSSNKTNLDMSDLARGNYFVKITIEGVSKTVKLIKN